MASPLERNSRFLPRTNRSFIWGAIPLLVAGYIISNSRFFLGHDASWFLYGSGRLVEGAKLYRDVMDVNPPLIFYLGVPAIWLARVFNVSDVSAFVAMVTVLCVLSVLVSTWLLRRLLAMSTDHCGLFALCLTFLLTFFSAGKFGQREHLMLILVFPYLMLVLGKLEGRKIGLRAAVIIGLVAGLGFALKPFFLAGWLFVEVYAAYSKHHRIVDATPEWIAVAALQVFYVVFTGVVHPEYVRFILDAGSVYNAFNVHFWEFLLHAETLLCAGACILAFSARADSEGRTVRSALLASTLGFFLAAFLQRKGWGYHYYPATVFALVLCAVSAISIVRRTRTRSSGFPGFVSRHGLLLSAAGVALSSFAIQGMRDPTRNPEYHLIPVVRHYAPGSSLLVLSESIAPAFPLVNYTDAKWSLRFPHLWFLPVLYHDRVDPQTDTVASRTPGEMSRVEKRFFDDVIEDILAAQPALIISDLSEMPRLDIPGKFDYLRYYRQDGRFEKLFTQYTYVQQVAEFAVYRRRENPSRADTTRNSHKHILWIVATPTTRLTSIPCPGPGSRASRTKSLNHITM